jgi:hypothetical protein
MNTGKKIAVLAAAGALIVTFISTVSPKAVRAALDEVRDVDNPERHTFTAQCTAPDGGSGLCSILVPPNVALFMDVISISGLVGDGSPMLQLAVQSTLPKLPDSTIISSSFTTFYTIPTFPIAGPPLGSSAYFVTLATKQANINSAVSFHIQDLNAPTTAPSFVVNIQGHLVAQP